MANIRKSFNFKGGVQVDEDNLLVNDLGSVGIGTTVPNETLDVRGNIKSTGVVTAFGAFISDGLESAGVSTFSNDVFIGAAITAYHSTGIISATQFRGDGGQLLNLPTSQWTDVDSGLGVTSIYNEGRVGISTIDPVYTLQIGGNNTVDNFGIGVGISSSGNVVISGIVTADVFNGNGANITKLNASNIRSGIVSSAYLEDGYQFAGIITANTVSEGFHGNVLGNVVGFATTARDLIDDLDLIFNSFTSNNAQVGIITVTGTLVTPSDGTVAIGIGTTNPQSDLHVKKVGISSIQISSDSNESILTLSRGIDQQGTAGVIKFGNESGDYPNSDSNSLDFINFSIGSVNNYLHAGDPGIGTGQFNWLKGKNTSQLMTLTSDGSLGIGRTDPANTLHVVGTGTITQAAFVGGKLTVYGGLEVNGNITRTGSGSLTLGDGDITGLNLDVSSGRSSVNDLVASNLKVSGITTTNTFLRAFDNFSAGVNRDFPITDNRAFGLNVDIDNVVAIGTAFPINTQGANALDVRYGKAIFNGVGVGTTSLTAAVDFRFAGRDNSDVVIPTAEQNRMYMYPPIVSTSERNSLVGMTTGALVYDTDLSTLCFYNELGWRKVTNTAA